MYPNPTTRQVVHLLARADRFNKLAKACPRPHRRGYYAMKDRALTRVLLQGASEFVVDSAFQDRDLVLGLTHTPSGRRVHVRPHRMPFRVQCVLHTLAHEAGFDYPILRLGINSDETAQRICHMVGEDAA